MATNACVIPASCQTENRDQIEGGIEYIEWLGRMVFQIWYKRRDWLGEWVVEETCRHGWDQECQTGRPNCKLAESEKRSFTFCSYKYLDRQHVKSLKNFQVRVRFEVIIQEKGLARWVSGWRGVQGSMGGIFLLFPSLGAFLWLHWMISLRIHVHHHCWTNIYSRPGHRMQKQHR